MDLVLIGILGYVLMQLLVGVAVSRRIRTEDDYLLAGRNLGYVLATFSIFATWFGAETCIGASGKVHEFGLSGATHDPLGYAACLLLMGVVFAVPLWKKKYTTLADLFRHRYSVGVERLAVLLMVPTSVLWAAAQIHAFGHVLAVSSEMGLGLAITLAAGVVIVYTVSGGLLADAVTDVVQGFCLIVGLFIIAFAMVGRLGGIEAAWTAIEPSQLSFSRGPETSILKILEEWSVPIFGSVVAQELISRVLASRTKTIARRATLVASGTYLIIGALPVMIGLLARKVGVDPSESAQILPTVAKQILSPVVYVLFAGALVSAILSTVDSALLAAASLVSHNLIVAIRPEMTEQRKVRVARVCVVMFGLSAYVLALHAKGVYELVEEASSFGSSGIFVVMAFGLFTRFGGRASAVAALVIGAGVWIHGNYWGEEDGTPYIYSLAAALLAYVVTAVLVRFIVASPVGTNSAELQACPVPLADTLAGAVTGDEE